MLILIISKFEGQSYGLRFNGFLFCLAFGSLEKLRLFGHSSLTHIMVSVVVMINLSTIHETESRVKRVLRSDF